MREKFLKLHAFLPVSYANGPGRRAVIWLQGCSKACPGCFNPALKPKERGKVVSVAELFLRLKTLETEVEGVSISGG